MIKNYIETKEQDLKIINEDFPNQLKNIIDLIKIKKFLNYHLIH